MPGKDWRSRWFRRRWPFFSGNIFDYMDEISKEMEEMMRRDLEEISRRTRNVAIEKKLPDGSTVSVKGPFIYGYSITIGPDGKPQIREFGNIKPSTVPGSPRIYNREEREPLVDVMESDGEIKVIAELPGVKKKDIKLHETETTLTISVDTPQQKYYKEVELPVEVTPKKVKSSYRNGVLEVTLPKRRGKPKEPVKT